MEDAEGGEAFAGTAVADYGSEDGRMFAMVLHPDSRTVGVHTFALLEKAPKCNQETQDSHLKDLSICEPCAGPSDSQSDGHPGRIQPTSKSVLIWRSRKGADEQADLNFHGHRRMTAKHLRIFRMMLIGAYVVIPLALALGTYEGWLFQSSTPSTSNSNIAVGVFVALVAATMLAEYAGVFERAATGREVLKAIAYWIGAMVWVLAVVRRVPDDRTGGTVLIGPLSALMLGGIFHLCRFGAMCTRSLARASQMDASGPA